ncbi:Helicase associated domain protein [Streptomyces sp. NBC_01190]|uniref:DEAD/DEAH box helicase n=1 Tax=Streptomyces sp. NBC_01190 TaxID=2903767 RepID=UPI00386A00F2|nr:Helicase associated domain protein [Streptomyces sp. NBC_01190]
MSPSRTPLWPHQTDAVRAATRSLKRLPRATIIAATGTGKTKIAIHVAEYFARTRSGRVLVLLPTLELLVQTAARWAQDSNIQQMVGVCSLNSIPDPAVNRLMRTLTTTPADLARVLGNPAKSVVVFSTYSSLDVIARAHRDHRLPQWTIVIADEAHRTSGELGKDWGAVHRDDCIPAERRLYMTATPRTWKLPDPKNKKKRRKKNDGQAAPAATAGPAPNQEAAGPTAPKHKTGQPKKLRAIPLASMDDASIYGPTVYQLGLADAIDKGILADYRIVVPVIDNDELKDVLQTKGPTPHLDGLRLSALQVGLLRAMAEHRLRRVISFHSRVAYAKRFAETLPATVNDTAAATKIRRLWVHAIHSKQPARHRAWHLQDFASVATVRRGIGPRDAVDGAVLANVRVLGEGVDVPDADAILFADPKCSPSDIVQCLGRALRQPPGAGKVATLIIPVYVSSKQTTQEAMQTSEFRRVWEVLTGLRTHDARIWRRLSGGFGGHPPDPIVPARPERADEIVPHTGTRAHEPEGTWAAGWDATMRFAEHHGHLDVPSEYTDPTGFALGHWVGQQRSLYAAGTLAPARAVALNTFKISWPHPPTSFEFHLDHAIEWATANGTLAIDSYTPGADPALARWLDSMRTRAENGDLPAERLAALNAVDPWWNPPWGLIWQRSYVQVIHRLADQSWAPNTLAALSQQGQEQWLDQQIANSFYLSAVQCRLLAQLARQHPRAHPHSMLFLRPLTPGERSFHRGLTAARQYLQREGHIAVPHSHTEMLDGQPVRLGRWLYRHRKNRAQLTPERADALTALGVELPPVFQEPDYTDAFRDPSSRAWPKTRSVPPAVSRSPFDDPFEKVSFSQPFTAATI